MEDKRKELWEEFYRNHSRPFWYFIYKICGDRDLADDIFQESHLKFIRAAPDVANENHLKAYLYKIAAHLIIDKQRRQKTKNRALEMERDVQRESMRQAKKENSFLTALDMRQKFSLLKPKERILLWLAYVEGYSLREISSFTAAKESSVKTQLFRARKKMAGILKPKDLIERVKE